MLLHFHNFLWISTLDAPNTKRLDKACLSDDMSIIFSPYVSPENHGEINEVLAENHIRIFFFSNLPIVLQNTSQEASGVNGGQEIIPFFTLKFLEEFERVVWAKKCFW